MLDISLSAAILWTLINIFLPLLPGVLFLRLFFGVKFKGILLYLLSRFIGVTVVAHYMFDIQFVWFTISPIAYVVLLALLIIWLVVKQSIGRGGSKASLSSYFETLSVRCEWNLVKESYQHLSKTAKFLTRAMWAITIIFWITWLVFTTNAPTYADDSFGNRDKPIVHILDDGGIKLFGAKEEILARGRLWYPIHIAVYKALTAQIGGGYSDVYHKLFQWLVFAIWMWFVAFITRERTKSIFLTLLPVTFICSLSLVFIHSVEWYHEILSAMYSILCIWAFYRYLESKDISYITLWLILGAMLAYAKNDGLVVYFPAVFISFLIILFIQKHRKNIITDYKKWNAWLGVVATWITMRLPFLYLKQFYHLGSNQAAGAESGLGLSSTLHREIFKSFGPLFWKMDNYGVALLGVFIIIRWLVGDNSLKKSRPSKIYRENLFYLILAPIALIVIFMLVFLATENYKFVLDQTTVNRVFTMCFVVLFAFLWFVVYDQNIKGISAK